MGFRGNAHIAIGVHTMSRKYKILDHNGNPATVTVSFEDGTYLEVKEFTSIDAVADIADTLKFHDIPSRIEVM